MHQYPLLIVNMLLHGGVIALLLLIACISWRDHGRRTEARLASAVAVGCAAFAFLSTPGVMFTRALPWHAPFLALSAANPLVFLLISRALLDDDFTLRRWHLLAWSAMAASGATLALVSHESDVGRLVLVVPAVVLSLMTALQAFTRWRDDLVEQRRRLRLAIVVGVTVWMLGTHLTLLLVKFGLLTNTISAAVLLGLAISVAWRLLSLPSELFAEASPALRLAVPADDVALPEVEQPDPRLIDTLNELMTVEQVYREENLTIAGLAQRMKLSEPRLRQLINKGLGHRNFNAFLNAYRVDDAKRALGDPRYAEVPILTISVEAGFQSLGPFNRAFKAATGLTPTDFRRAAATGAPANSAFG